MFGLSKKDIRFGLLCAVCVAILAATIYGVCYHQQVIAPLEAAAEKAQTEKAAAVKNEFSGAQYGDLVQFSDGEVRRYYGTHHAALVETEYLLLDVMPVAWTPEDLANRGVHLVKRGSAGYQAAADHFFTQPHDPNK